MAIKLALVGNPNCGKTTMFNGMTGSNQYVGNWPGVTVEKKEGKLKGYSDVLVTDLPGIYSLSPYTLEEVVSRTYLMEERPNAVINLVDATNLERNLYLTTQLMEMGIPVVLALNMMDLVEKNGDTVDAALLSSRFGCPVVEVSSLKGTGLDTLYQKAVEAASKQQGFQPPHTFSPDVEEALAQIDSLLEGKIPPEERRWYTIKLFERDTKVLAALEHLHLQEQIDQIVSACEEKAEDDSESLITNDRYTFITSALEGVYTRKHTGLSVSDRIDRIVTHRLLALPIFAGIMFLVYYIAIGTVGDFLTVWTNEELFGSILPPMVEGFLVSIGCHEILVSLIVDGILAGVGAVLGFVPQMLVLFLMLSILEDCGYMARVAFIMDRIFRRMGLSGKSFIPMLIGSGCGVPGVMASRTIEQDRDRKMTIMTTCFVPCGAKMPIVGLFAGALFGGSGLVAVSAYFIGMFAIVASGVLLKKFKAFAGDPAPFVMELPAYHVPTCHNVLRSTWDRGLSFIQRAGTIILLSAILMWFLQGFGIVDGNFVMVEDNNHSLLAVFGSYVAILFGPLGFGDWQSTVATFTGLVAKENVVNTFGVLFHVGNEVTEEDPGLWQAIAAHYTPVAAYSFMIFNLLCAPCFAAMGAIQKEMNNSKWSLFAISYMCVFAYGIALIVYQLGGLLLGTVSFGLGTVAALLTLALLIYLLVRKGYSGDQSARLSIHAREAV